MSNHFAGPRARVWRPGSGTRGSCPEGRSRPSSPRRRRRTAWPLPSGTVQPLPQLEVHESAVQELHDDIREWGVGLIDRLHLPCERWIGHEEGVEDRLLLLGMGRLAGRHLSECTGPPNGCTTRALIFASGVNGSPSGPHHLVGHGPAAVERGSFQERTSRAPETQSRSRD